MPRYPPLDILRYLLPHRPKGVVIALESQQIGPVSHSTKVASLPFRFKAGGEAKMPGAVAFGHSHRPTTKVSNKAFKSRKATKGALRNAAKGESRRNLVAYMR